LNISTTRIIERITERTGMNVYMDIQFKDWILGGVLREASQATTLEVKIKYVSTSRRKYPLKYLSNRYLRRIRIRKGDLIVNQRTLFYLVQRGLIPKSQLTNLRCHFTHDNPEHLVESGSIEILKQLNQVLVLNKADHSMLTNLGVEESKIRVIYGAVDRKIFYPAKDSEYDNFVLITGDCKGRKNPQKVFDVVSSNPNLNFVICGRNWENFDRNIEAKYPNLRILEFSMKLNAKLMRGASTFMTLSLQEGGPFPVLEALASGTPVLATPVGWIPEVVNPQNGRIVENSSSLVEISTQLHECINLKRIVGSEDLLYGKFTWVELSKQFFENTTN
jgi:glycosyltransferase involved in cell wall biosynthesis